MPRLPNNLVKPPKSGFDNPIRRTADADSAPAELSAPTQSVSTLLHDTGASEEVGAPVIAIGITAKADSPPDLGELAMTYRITVRIDDSTRRALEADNHKRRLAGEKTNVAEVARGILKNWARRAARAE